MSSVVNERASSVIVMLATVCAIATACGRDASESRRTASAGETTAAALAVPVDSTSGGDDAAATAARSYLEALVRRDYARAANLWEEGATDGAGDSAAFRRAHGDTTVTGFDVGTPGRVEGAAGSRYVQVPITMQGSTPDRPPLRLHGIVTLRRSAVDGASEAQRRWRIARLEWSSNAKPAQGR